MPRQPPPATCPGVPVLTRLPKGRLLWRVHPGNRFPTAMNPNARPSPLTGGRFDSLDGSYAYLYLGADERAALAETICRDLPLDGTARLVPHAALAGRVLSQLRVTRAITVVRVHGAALTQLGQDTWLTKSDPADYPTTRAWAQAIRLWAPTTAGFAYRCRHDEDRRAYVLFTDPDTSQHPRLSPIGAQIRLDEPTGVTLARRVLAEHHAALSRGA